MEDCPQEELKSKYTIEKFCIEISDTYSVDLTYKKYKRYIDQEAFPDDPKLIQALAKAFGVSFEYMYGLSDLENEVTASIEQLLPINTNAINTLRNLYGHDEAIKILNAILTDAGNCSAELSNMYEEQYQIYKSKALNNPYDYETARRRIVSAELFANYIEGNIPIAVVYSNLLISYNCILQDRLHSSCVKKFRSKLRSFIPDLF